MCWSAFRFDYYGAQYTAFFTPVQTGLHTFFVAANDIVELYLANPNNITEQTL